MAEEEQNPSINGANECPGSSLPFLPLLPPVADISLRTPDSPCSSGALSLRPFVGFTELAIKEKVGHGSYGVVYKAVWRERFVAVKEFGASAEQKAIETEVKQLSRVQHHNIIELFGISADQQSKYLIMEYAEGGSLHNFLHGKVKPFYSTAHAMSWARQCAEGVAYLHAMKPKPLIHRDLKPLNLLLTNKGRLLKICDFGTVADKSTWMTNNKGSAAWMAPEVFEGSKYTEKCDIFSWAIVLWEVLSRQQPFKEIDNTYSIMWKIHKGERPPMINGCPKIIQDLMTSCWATTPDLRPSMQHVVSVMNELASSFPGADEPLEYEFVNQQIIHTSSSESIGNYTLDFSTFHSSSNNTSSTQVTPTNQPMASTNTSSSSTTATNASEVTTNINNINSPNSSMPVPSITASTRWDVIPEESDSMIFHSVESVGGEGDGVGVGLSTPFNESFSADSSKRYETIRNGMTQMASVLMAPLSVDVDANAWELAHSDGTSSFGAKSDGKERLTVTDAKPMIPTKDSSNMTEENTCNDADGGDDDDEDIDDTDQSLTEVLDPELRPEPPIPGNNESQAIYREHRRLAKEYLRVDTKLYYAQDFKEKLVIQMDPAERQEKQELLKKISEKEGLLELYNNLKQQLEKLNSEAKDVASASASTSTTPVQRQWSQNDVDADDGWVVIQSNQQNT